MGDFISSSELVASSVLQQQTCLEMNDKKLHIMCQSYGDRHFVLITQNRKIGTLIQAWAEEVPSGGKLYQTRTIFGCRDNPLLSGIFCRCLTSNKKIAPLFFFCTVYARKIIELISETSEKPLLLGICLKLDEEDAETFRRVIEKVSEVQTWNR